MVGMLAGRLDLLEENFVGRLGRMKIAEGGDFIVFNDKKQLIVHPDREILAEGKLSSSSQALVDRVIKGFEGSGETVTRTGERVLCSFKRLKTTGWTICAKLPVSEAYATIHRAERMVLWSLALALPISLVIVWVLVGRLTRPLLWLAQSVGDMGGKGGAFQPLGVDSKDEIGVLAAAFDGVMQELESQKALLEKEKRFAQQLLQHTAVPCYVIDAEHRVIIWNRACEELTGLSAAEVLGTREPWRPFYQSQRQVLADVIIDGNLHEMSELYGCYSDSPLIPEGLRAERWVTLKGKQRYLTFDAAPIRGADGRMIAAIQTLQDVTLRASTEEQLRGMVEAIGESEERFRRLVELSLDGIAILVNRRFAFINPAGCEMLGALSPEELNGRAMRDFILRESEELFEEQLEYTEKTGANAPWVEERLLRKDGTSLDVELGVGRFIHRGEEALQVIFRDITERRLAKARLETLAHYDSLTSLPNRVLFFDRLQHAVSEAERHRHALALMFLDLDRFKEINDTLGHAAGDVVLVEAGRRLKECVRACDMVARMGGDEFTIILSKMADELDAALVAERIVQSLSVPFMVEGTVATIGVSIGICVYPTYATDLDGMVRQADLALYRAKGDGRNGYHFYSPELEAGARG
jgi:diguanylate cyclase (GGDEF)-like protein/PAS domain S-box-containing protein